MAAYHNVPVRDGFGNFATLLQDVTLSPTMAFSRSMLQSAAAPPGQIANENYARELMKLLSICPNQLKPDGTLVLYHRR